METFVLSRLLGRLLTYGRTFVQEDVLYFNWSGDTLECCFRGTHLNARFRADCGFELEGMPGDTDAPKRATWPRVAIFLDDMKHPVRTFQVSSPDETWLLYTPFPKPGPPWGRRPAKDPPRRNRSAGRDPWTGCRSRR